MTRAVAVVALGAALLVGPPLSTIAGADDTNPIESSRDATRSLSFEGVVRVEWIDGDVHRTERVTVRSRNGTMFVSGGRDLAASERARFVYHRGLGWALVWPEQLEADERPAPQRKYQLVARGAGATVAGRATKAIDVRRAGVLWERLHVDARTGLVLRREQYGADGALDRVVTFESLDTSTSMATPVSVPARAADQSPDTVPGMRPSAPYRAPTSLGAGYRLIGAYRQSGTVQLLYSDGVYDLSVFEQRGRLDRHDLPSQRRRVTLAGDRDGWRVGWPGGEVVVWQGGSAVYTVVGEAPFSDVLAAARSMPSAGRPTLVEKLRRACRRLLDVV